MSNLQAMDIAHFFIWKSAQSEGEATVSNLKLQKLIYYAKGYYLALYKQSLFPEYLVAWRHGPVVPSVYHEFKGYGGNPIPEVTFDRERFTEVQITFLNEIWDVFGQYSAWKLREMSHNDTPWIEHEADASIIPDEELQAYFSTRLA